MPKKRPESRWLSNAPSLRGRRPGKRHPLFGQVQLDLEIAGAGAAGKFLPFTGPRDRAPAVPLAARPDLPQRGDLGKGAMFVRNDKFSQVAVVIDFQAWVPERQGESESVVAHGRDRRPRGGRKRQSGPEVLRGAMAYGSQREELRGVR